LINYILTEKIVKIKLNKIEIFEDCLIDKINHTLAYSKNTNPIDVKMDNITKWVILCKENDIFIILNIKAFYIFIFLYYIHILLLKYLLLILIFYIL